MARSNTSRPTLSEVIVFAADRGCQSHISGFGRAFDETRWPGRAGKTSKHSYPTFPWDVQPSCLSTVLRSEPVKTIIHTDRFANSKQRIQRVRCAVLKRFFDRLPPSRHHFWLIRTSIANLEGIHAHANFGLEYATACARNSNHKLFGTRSQTSPQGTAWRQSGTQQMRCLSGLGVPRPLKG